MKNLLTFFLLIIPLILCAQHPGGGFSGKDYVLHGESEIVLKDGTKVICKNRINGTKIGKTNINYKDVDYIRLVKTSLRGFEFANGATYKFITVKNKPQLVKIVIETPRLSFYRERPKMTGGGHNALGQFQPHGVTNGKMFVIKDNNENAETLDGKNMDKLFSDCPRLIQYYNDKQLNEKLTIEKLAYIYNKGNCKEATEAEIQKEDIEFEEYLKSKETKK